jgi:hypothetical protein
MRFMNEYDISSAISRHARRSQPNRLGAALVISNLADWTNANSDGWSHWPKPARAASKLAELADRWDATEDATDAELAAAVKPVKAFLTRMARETNRHGGPLCSPGNREVILRGAERISA